MKNNHITPRNIILASLIMLFQLIIIGFTMFYLHLWFTDTKVFNNITCYQITIILISAGLILSLLSIYLLRVLIMLTRKENESDIISIRLHDTRELLDNLRAQRHDFINHLQVIYGLIQLNKIQNVKEYIKDISGDNTEMGD